MSGSLPIKNCSRVLSAFEGLRERRQQHQRLGVAARQSNRAMQRDNRLAGAGRSRDPRRPGVAALDELALRRMQKHRPFRPRKVERAFQLLDIGQHPEAALRVRMGERVGGCGGWCRDRRGPTSRQVQQRLGRLLRQAIGYIEQRILGRLTHRIEPFDWDAVSQQHVIGYANE
jgi:hypothetical protein